MKTDRETTPPRPLELVKPRTYGIKELMEDYGYTELDALVAECVYDSVSPAICTVCGYTTDMEPDQDRGWCEICEKGTVKSALILLGMI
jgi:hypothetical protein